jgi:hypothetical protein
MDMGVRVRVRMRMVRMRVERAFAGVMEGWWML